MGSGSQKSNLIPLLQDEGDLDVTLILNVRQFDSVHPPSVLEFILEPFEPNL